MANATIQIHEMTGTATGLDKTSGTVRFKSADETTVDTNNKVQVPGAGTTYSYNKQLRFYIAGMGTSSTIENLQAYTDGSNDMGTGVDVYYNVSGSHVTHTDATIGTTDLFTATTASPIDMDATNTAAGTGTGYLGDFLEMQLAVGTTAGPGQTGQETVTFSYDES